MKSLFLLPAVALLAACNQSSEPEVVDLRGRDPNAAEIANRPAVKLPPAIRAQHSYRCTGNDLVYVTWYVGDEFIDAREEEGDAPTRLTSTTGASPWTSAVGWTVAGDDKNIRITVPGKAIRDCHT